MDLLGWIQMKNYAEALKWFDRIDFERQKIEHHSIIEIQYKSSVALRNTGKTDKALLLLRNMIFSDLNDGCLSFYYLNGIIDLARYYINSKQGQEADKVLSKILPDIVEHMEELIGENYILLMAEKSLQESNINQALKYYKKAYAINAQKEIGEIIKMIE